jgi:SPP1 gp7 family putative phage head morphogenesis protein
MTATADRILTLELDFKALVRKASAMGAPLIEQAAVAAAERMLAQHKGYSGVSHQAKFNETMLKLSGLVVRVMAFADLLARVRLVRDTKRDARIEGDKPDFGRYRSFDAAAVYARISDDLPDFLTQPFNEAIDDFASREPVIERSAQAVAEAYQRHQFSMAYSASLEINQQVKDMILRALRGEGGQDTGQRVPSGPGERDIKVLTPTGIEEIVGLFREQQAPGFSTNYAHVVFRTNISTAQSAGRLAMAADPDMAQFLLGWEYIARLDAATRENHRAMHGHMAATGDPVWRIWSPPNGYQCRCGLLEISKYRARRLERVDAQGQFISDPFPSVRPDKNFEQSPLGAIYG